MKGVCLISGGIDSPVAAQIAILNNIQPILLHYHNYPFNSIDSLKKVVILSNKLIELNPEINMSLAIIPHGKSQKTIIDGLNNREKRQTCLLCRIQMFIKAQMFAKNLKADFIITGEILGEQASQTLDNLSLIKSNIDILVLRPLIGYNKEEVIQLSRKWGFYTSSILPGDCCSIIPKYPETKGRLDVIEKIYKRESEKLTSTIHEELKEIHFFELPVNLEIVLSEIEIQK